jgi:hypothetical protein
MTHESRPKAAPAIAGFDDTTLQLHEVLSSAELSIRQAGRLLEWAAVEMPPAQRYELQRTANLTFRLADRVHRDRGCPCLTGRAP